MRAQEQLQRDFKAGMREMVRQGKRSEAGKLVGTVARVAEVEEEDEDDDEDDAGEPEGEDAGQDTTAEVELPVFTVSAREFQRLSSAAARDSSACLRSLGLAAR
jgi:hypothetical protein